MTAAEKATINAARSLALLVVRHIGWHQHAAIRQAAESLLEQIPMPARSIGMPRCPHCQDWHADHDPCTEPPR